MKIGQRLHAATLLASSLGGILSSPHPYAEWKSIRDAERGYRIGIGGHPNAPSLYDTPPWGQPSWSGVRHNPSGFSVAQAAAARFRPKGPHPINAWLGGIASAYAGFYDSRSIVGEESYIQALENLIEKYFHSAVEQLKRIVGDEYIDQVGELWKEGFQPKGLEQINDAKLGLPDEAWLNIRNNPDRREYFDASNYSRDFD